METRGMDGSVITSAADAMVRAIVNCEVTEQTKTGVCGAFHTISCLRFCLTSSTRSYVLLSSNFFNCGDLTFKLVDARSSFSRHATASCQPAFLVNETLLKYSDLEPVATQDGCRALFCVPLPPHSNGDGSNPSSSVQRQSETDIGALIIGFKDQVDVVDQDLRTVLLLARHLSVTHRRTLVALSKEVTPALSPSGSPKWGDAGGLLAGSQTGQVHVGYGDDLSDNADDEDDPYPILDPVQHALFRGVTPLTLAFPHPFLEAAYQLWRSERMARVDSAALTTLLAYHVACVLAPLSSGVYTSGELPEVVPVVVLLMPLVIGAIRPAHAWYCRHRNAMLSFVFATLAWCHISSRSPGSGEDCNVHMAQLGIAGVQIAWIAILSVVIQVRYPVQVSLLVAALATRLAMVYFKAGVPLTCWLVIAARTVVVELFLPVFLLYRLEQSSRKTFCATPFATSWAWTQ